MLQADPAPTVESHWLQALLALWWLPCNQQLMQCKTDGAEHHGLLQQTSGGLFCSARSARQRVEAACECCLVAT